MEMAMRTLLKGGRVINVFTGEIESLSVLIEDERIVGVGDYTDKDADRVHDVGGRYICPGFIDGHIHIESTMLSPCELARATLPRGTTAVVADPHEIANVCGTAGIDYMLQASEGLPQTVYVMLPSCVPSTRFCESGATLEAEQLEPYYTHPRVLGLAEVMNYVGVVMDDEGLLRKIESARAHGAIINGHAPTLSGSALDKYISKGIGDDHECTSEAEAKERIRKGQRVMIRQGTAARNLESLLPLFDEPWAHRCLLVSDDKHPADLLACGHIDDIIRCAVAAGKDAVTAIRMATLFAAEHFGLHDIGAVAPGYAADIVVFDDLEKISVTDVYHRGVLAVEGGRMLPFAEPAVEPSVTEAVRCSFALSELAPRDFEINVGGVHPCRVIEVVRGQLLTNEKIVDIDFDSAGGIDIQRDILKLAVIERHHNTGHRGIGFINGIGLKCGAIAASVSHDSHNLIVIGANDADMAVAANRIRRIGGGSVVVRDGEVLAELALPIAGLMSDLDCKRVAEQNEAVRRSVYELGAPNDVEPFMNMAFVSLPVIPSLKMTTLGLVDVNRQELVPLLCDIQELSR